MSLKNRLRGYLSSLLFRNLRNDYGRYYKGQILTPVFTPDLPRGHNMDLPYSLYLNYISKVCLKGQSLKTQVSVPKTELKGEGQCGEGGNSRGSPCVFLLSFSVTSCFPQTTSASPHKASQAGGFSLRSWESAPLNAFRFHSSFIPLILYQDTPGGFMPPKERK